MNNAPTLLRLREVLSRTGLGSSTLYRRIAAREFPAPRDLGGNAVAWRSDEVANWIEGRPVAAGHKPGPVASVAARKQGTSGG